MSVFEVNTDVLSGKNKQKNKITGAGISAKNNGK